MKRTITIIFLFISVFSFAQRPFGPPPHPPGGEKLRALKIGMITEEINLTEAQATRFWPVYNAYSEERMQIHKQIRELTRSNDGASNTELIQRQDEILELRQKEINVVKKYRESFLKVISPQQYADMMEAERKFNDMLLQKLRDRRD